MTKARAHTVPPPLLPRHPGEGGTLVDMNDISGKIVDSCIKIHKNIGPGLLESAYQQCLAYELEKRAIPFEQERILPVRYEEIFIQNAYRIDFLVCGRIII